MTIEEIKEEISAIEKMFKGDINPADHEHLYAIKEAYMKALTALTTEPGAAVMKIKEFMGEREDAYALANDDDKATIDAEAAVYGTVLQNGNYGDPLEEYRECF